MIDLPALALLGINSDALIMGDADADSPEIPRGARASIRAAAEVNPHGRYEL